MTAALGDLLLWAITARGELSFDAFTSLWTNVLSGREDINHVPSQPYSRMTTIRQLDALGHCETAAVSGERVIAISRPCLSRLPSFGAPRAILTGRRQPDTLDLVLRAARTTGCIIRLNPLDATGALLPPSVEIDAASPEALAATAETLGIAWQPVPSSLSLVEHLAPLDDHFDRLEWTSMGEMNWYKTFFNPMSVKMSKLRFEGPLNLLRYEHPHSRRVHFELRRGDERATVDGDWGRFAMLRTYETNVAIYDPRRHLLAGLAGAPFPRLVRRSLTMASGRPATSGILPGSFPVFPRRLVEVYRNVSPSLAVAVKDLLGQQTLLFGKLDEIGEARVRAD